MAASFIIFQLIILLLSPLYYVSLSEFVLPLTHSLSKTKFTSTHHLLKSTTSRSAARFSHRHRHQQVSLPLSPGSDYTLSFSLGGSSSSSSSSVSLYLDTGSDMVWLHCHPFECILCENKQEKPRVLLYFEELKSTISKNTRAILMNTPHNPTGKMFTREEVNVIASLCIENDVLVFSDEVYDKLDFEMDHISIASLPGMYERTVTNY